jgi:hypothetical protein
MRHIWPFLLVIACDRPFHAPNEEVFVPPPEYREWHGDMERCSGRRGAFAAITWIKADLGPHYLGRTEALKIWIDRDWLTSWYVVSHEVLHTLIRDGGHRSPLWEACGVKPNLHLLHP